MVIVKFFPLTGKSVSSVTFCDGLIAARKTWLVELVLPSILMLFWAILTLEILKKSF
jgi:hypothetical protein